LTGRDRPEEKTPSDEPSAAEGVNAADLFYWMEEAPGADIPLCALWIEVPTGCRFCC
jgi:hypothetical protein